MIKEWIPCRGVTVGAENAISKLLRRQEFDWIDADILDDRFPPMSHGGNLPSVLVRFDGHTLTPEVVAEFKRLGIRPMVAGELVTLQCWRTKIRTKRASVVALGQSWSDQYGNRHFPCLLKEDRRIGLGLAWEWSTWGPHCYFAGIDSSTL
jgi:hypothetical protein